MRKVFILLFIYTLIFSKKLIAQSELASFIAYYDFSLKDSSGKTSVETFMLCVSKRGSVFKSMEKYMLDSSVGTKTFVQRDGSKITVSDYNPLLRKFTTSEIFSNLKEKVYITTDDLMMKKYFIEDAVEQINWEIKADTSTIFGFKCQKAIGLCKGRVYKCWFSSSIPQQEGPWKLKGLPGLIMYASDEKNEITFSLTGLQSGNSIPVERGSFIIPQGYVKTSKIEFLQAYKAMKENPLAFIEAQTNLKVQIQGRENSKLNIKKVEIPKLYRIELAN